MVYLLLLAVSMGKRSEFIALITAISLIAQSFGTPYAYANSLQERQSLRQASAEFMRFSIPHGPSEEPGELTVFTAEEPEVSYLLDGATELELSRQKNGTKTAMVFSTDDTSIASDSVKTKLSKLKSLFVTTVGKFKPVQIPAVVKKAAIQVGTRVANDKLTFLYFCYRIQNNYLSWIHVAHTTNMPSTYFDVLLAFTTLMITLRYDHASSAAFTDTVAKAFRITGETLRILSREEAVDFDSLTPEERRRALEKNSPDYLRGAASLSVGVFQQLLQRGLINPQTLWTWETMRDIGILMLFSSFASYGFNRAFDRWNKIWPVGSQNVKERPMSHNSVNRFQQIRLSLQIHLSPEAHFLYPHEHWLFSGYKLVRLGFGIAGLAFLYKGETIARELYEKKQSLLATLKRLSQTDMPSPPLCSFVMNSEGVSIAE